MDSVQDLCSQLMKSPRELALWNFPLSQILDEYFNLLPETYKISFGEAAFIIQNSVNAYVRKVEELYDETKSFSKKIIVNQDKDEKNKLKGKKLKKNYIDLSLFDYHLFSEEIGKNINLKNFDQKPVKFLHQCFSSLENSNNKLDIKVYDNQGEVIGKKYNFRCNQSINKNGTLVGEITTNDFDMQNYACSPVLFVEVKENFQSPVQFFNSDHINPHNKDLSTTYKKSSDFTKIDEKNNITAYNDLLDKEEFMDCTTLKNFKAYLAEDNIVNNFNQINNSLPGSTIAEKKKIKVSLNDKNNLTFNSSNENKRDSKFKLKRSERLKKKFEKVKKINVMQPITFSTGIPEKLDKSRKEFKIPCNISLLKNVSQRPTDKPGKKKIKSISELDNLSNKNPTYTVRQDVNHKCLIFSPTVSFLNIMEKKTNNFKRNLQERYTKESNFSVQSVTALNMNHSGLSTQTKIDPYWISAQQELDSSSNLRIFTPNVKSPLQCFEYHDLSNLSILSENFDPCSKKELKIPVKKRNTRERNMLNSDSKYNKLVKCKIEEIYKELDLQTEEDQQVAKWHQEIKPRLKEAELKTPFCIHDYESKIKDKLKISQKKLTFDDIVREEPPCEIARYFSATLQLASTNNLNINSKKNFEKSIELILLD